MRLTNTLSSLILGLAYVAQVGCTASGQGAAGQKTEVPPEVLERASTLFVRSESIKYRRITMTGFGVKVTDPAGTEIEYFVQDSGFVFMEAAAGVHEKPAVASTAGQPREAAEQMIARGDIPPDVWRIASRQSEGVRFDHCVLGDEDGLRVYEIVFKEGRREIEVNVTPAADLCGAEEEVESADVPEKIRHIAETLARPGANLAYERRTMAGFDCTGNDNESREAEYLVTLAGAAFRKVR